jgi:hypothetical protein
MFNTSVFFIASTGFFGTNCLGGDTTLKEKIGSPSQLGNSTSLFDLFITGAGYDINLGFGTYHIGFSFAAIMGIISVVGIGIAIKTSSTTPLALIIISGAFMFMITNSLRLIDSLKTQFAAPTWYLFAMIGLGVLLLLAIEIVDIASMQRSTD